MRNAMATAEVGDDVFGDDPSVRRLENRVAELLGKHFSKLSSHLLLPFNTQLSNLHNFIRNPPIGYLKGFPHS